MFLIYDTETNGLPLWKQPSDHPDQPHLVQLAFGIYASDGKELEFYNRLIRPAGWTISEEMTAIHGISQARAEEEGIAESMAIDALYLAMARAVMRVAHNESFDLRIARIALLRAGYQRPLVEAIEAQPAFCTCEKSKSIVNLPPSPAMKAKGMNMPKSPKLAECITHFFKEDMQGAHNAEHDVRACARVFFHLRTLGLAA